jgi:hypothetical protein
LKLLWGGNYRTVSLIDVFQSQDESNTPNIFTLIPFIASMLPIQILSFSESNLVVHIIMSDYNVFSPQEEYGCMKHA